MAFRSRLLTTLMGAQTFMREPHPLNVELPADSLVTDQVFRRTIGNGRDLVLHIELQGRRSSQPMPWRMLGYVHRLAGT
jgi:hypothetical protein